MTNRNISKENAAIAEAIDSTRRMRTSDSAKVIDFINTKNHGYIKGMWQFDSIFNVPFWYDYTNAEWKAFMTKLANQLNKNSWTVTD